MYLKSIEVQGFKSFAHKMTFKFHKGITGIVGPNGSGKSNVADAVRWVLGEQSAKQLRGSKMEDVIFSGTQNRKPLGFAYVAITLDNKDHKLPVDFDAVTVARRVYRSGESEYLLNGSTCRLKDVQELFFDTGIGKEGYSIIGQGQIDKILSGKPEERRELFDEAAGIVKFKKRKSIAEKNLEIEKQNLFRVNDILSELERQIGPLSGQAEKAKQYLKLKEELKKYDINLFLTESVHIKKQQSELDGRLKIVNDDLFDTRKSFDKTKEEYVNVESKLALSNQKIDDERNQLSEHKLEKERLEGEINVLNERLHSARQMIESSHNRIVEIKQTIVDKKAEFNRLSDEYNEAVKSLVELKQRRHASDNHLADMNNMLESLHSEIESKNADVIEYLNEAAGVKSKIGRYDAMIEQINIRKSELNNRLILLKTEEDSKSQAVDKYEERLNEVLELISQSNNKGKELEKKEVLIQGELNETRDTLSAKEQEYHALTSKYSTLKNLSERYEGYGGSIKRVMEQKEAYPGIIGVVADIIKVEKKYETAIEIALGGSIQNIVTEDEATAKQIIEYLKKNKYGRATFLPLSNMRFPNNSITAQILKEKGIIGVASDLVTREERFDALIGHLLGRIVIAEDIDDALLLARKYKHSLRIVTLGGELINPGGAIAGGAYRNTSNLLGRSREITEIRKTIQSIKKEIESFIQKRQSLQDEKTNNRSIIEKNRREALEYSIQEKTLIVKRKQAKFAQENSANAYAELEKEDMELNRQIADIKVSKDSLSKALKEKEEQKLAAEAIISQLNLKLEQHTDNAKTYGEKNAKLRIEHSSFEQKMDFITENISRINQEIQKDENDIDQINAAVAFNNQEICQKEKDILERRDHLEKQDVLIEKSEKRLLILIEKKEEMSKQHKSFFEQREHLSERVNELDKEVLRLNHQNERLTESGSSLNNYMWEEYKLTYNNAMEFKSDELLNIGVTQLKKSMNQVRTEIKNLGDVNVNAIEEYKNVSERYSLLKMQHDDLVDAEAKLHDIIESLDKAMREQFIEKFRLIQINFDKVFQELFGGGKGSLELMEDEDILYAGVRIIAQPPGKKLQNMMQLSGGEKALTAIALLFAIQNLKPSPFCLLDEIEAALDDANVKRFAQYLNNLTKDTQFIIITHRRGTMNAADALYGITMQEKGISTLVSVSLIDSKLEN